MQLSLAELPTDVKKVYREFWRRWLVHHIVATTWQNSPSHYHSQEFFIQLLNTDLQRVILDAAVYAWISINPYKHNLYCLDDPDIPEDLLYGIIVQEFTCISRIAAFASGLTHSTEFHCLSNESRQEAKKYALENTVMVFKNEVAEQEIIRIVTKLHY